MTSHAAASPSSAAMWMNCPASITQAKDVTRPSSIYAKEGTAAHRIAEMIIQGELFPPGKITVEGSEFIVGLPMLKALNPYIDFVQKLQTQCQELFIEKRVTLKGSRNWVWGTTDCVGISSDELNVVDLKYGTGIAVKPDSPQLKIYALSAYDTLWSGNYISQINLTVVQPRVNPAPQTITLASDELWDWNLRELRPAVDRIAARDPTENPGRWCRWCVRRNECAGYAKHKNSNAAEIFDDGLDTMSI